MTPAQRAQQDNRDRQGQYRHKQQTESDLSLAAEHHDSPGFDEPPPDSDTTGDTASAGAGVGMPAWLAGRHRQLTGDGYTPAGFWPSARDPARRDNARQWWDQAHATGEYSPEYGYPAMPEHANPGRTGGNSVTGRRLTHTRSYHGGGVTVRMPSAAAVRRFADQVGGSTFRIPVEASADTRQGRKTVTCWMTCTRHGPGNWTVTPQGVTGHTGAQTSEAVASILEARRPTTALAEAGDLAAKHRQREAGSGAPMRSPGKSWIQKLGYNRQDRLLVMQSATGSFGYDADEDEYQQVLDATGADGDHVGSRFNKVIKADKQRERHQVTSCGQCGRTYRADQHHTCPTHTRPLPDVVGQGLHSLYRARGAKALERLAA